MKENKLSIIGIAVMYLGVIMGAGFSSGRESWQFFGVFGKIGYLGTLFSVAVFILMALMLTYIALSKNTSDIGQLISPLDSPLLIQGLGYVMAAIYYTLIMTMSAAGGSLLNQMLGIDKKIGGIIIVILVIFTVLGNFDRMSSVFGKIMPVVFTVTMVTVLLVITGGITAGGTAAGSTAGAAPSEMAPNWWSSGIIFASYNGLGMLSIAGSCALRAKNRNTAFLGAGLGASLLGVLMILLLTALLKDPGFSSALDLPMLGYAGRISGLLSICYSIVLYGSIYATASSTFYGFSTKLPDVPAKKLILIGAAVIGYLLGLLGFQTLVAYLYPAQGYLGIIIILMISVNFYKEYRKNKKGH